MQGDFQTQKEAAWAVSNLTISGRKDQVYSYEVTDLMCVCRLNITWTSFIYAVVQQPQPRQSRNKTKISDSVVWSYAT